MLIRKEVWKNTDTQPVSVAFTTTIDVQISFSTDIKPGTPSHILEPF
jgi:hypothetical protein